MSAAKKLRARPYEPRSRMAFFSSPTFSFHPAYVHLELEPQLYIFPSSFCSYSLLVRARTVDELLIAAATFWMTRTTARLDKLSLPFLGQQHPCSTKNSGASLAGETTCSANPSLSTRTRRHRPSLFYFASRQGISKPTTRTWG